MSQTSPITVNSTSIGSVPSGSFRTGPQVLPPSLSQPTQRVGVSDELKISTEKAGVADSAEPQSPKLPKKDGLDRLQKGRKDLEEALKKSGKSEQDVQGEKLEKVTRETLKEIQTQLLLEGDKKSPNYLRLQKMENELSSLLNAYVTAYLGSGVIGESTDVLPEASQSVQSPEEVQLVQKLNSLVLSELNIKGDTSVEETLKLVQAEYQTKLKAIDAKQKTLDLSKAELEIKLNQAKTPEEKATLSQKIEKAEKDLAQLVTDQKTLETTVQKILFMGDKAIAFKTQRELGITKEPEKSEETETKEMSRTLSSQSVTESKPEVSKSEERSFLRIASVSDQTSQTSNIAEGAPLDSPTSGAPTLAINDTTGTSFSLMQSTNQLRDEARKTDRLIKQLLAAAARGDWNAVVLAMVMIDKNAQLTMTKIGIQSTQALSAYQKQMEAVTTKLSQLSASDTSYASKATLANQQLNQLNMNMSTINNLLKDVMSMRQVTAENTSGIIRKSGEISVTAARG